MQAQPR